MPDTEKQNCILWKLKNIYFEFTLIIRNLKEEERGENQYRKMFR